jgi:hypothetical protein
MKHQASMLVQRRQWSWLPANAADMIRGKPGSLKLRGSARIIQEID